MIEMVASLVPSAIAKDTTQQSNLGAPLSFPISSFSMFQIFCGKGKKWFGEGDDGILERAHGLACYLICV